MAAFDLTGRGSARDGRAEDSLLGGEVDLDRGVATGVEDLTGENLLDRHGDNGLEGLEEVNSNVKRRTEQNCNEASESYDLQMNLRLGPKSRRGRPSIDQN